MAIFAYSRVSKKEQTIENQRLEIIQAGYSPDYYFDDVGVSGSLTASQRPQFSALLEKIRDGETLVVSKLDRLGRNAMDVRATLNLLSSRSIKVIVLQLGNLDLTSPAGKLMLTLLAAVAEMERDLLIERTQAGLARAMAQGKTMGRPTSTTPKQQAEIISKRAAGSTVSALSREYGVSRITISRITGATDK